MLQKLVICFSYALRLLRENVMELQKDIVLKISNANDKISLVTNDRTSFIHCNFCALIFAAEIKFGYKYTVSIL